MTMWNEITDVPGVDGDCLVELKTGELVILFFGPNENDKYHWLDYKGRIMDKKVLRWGYLQHLRHKKDTRRLTL